MTSATVKKRSYIAKGNYYGTAGIHSLAKNKIGAISLLGSDAKLQFQCQDDGLHIQFPAVAPCKYAYAFRTQVEATLQ
jgi:hypothetical protein